MLFFRFGLWRRGPDPRFDRGLRGPYELEAIGLLQLIRWELVGFAKFVVVKRPAKPARERINPFTKEKQKFAAACQGVKACPVNAIQDAVDAVV